MSERILCVTSLSALRVGFSETISFFALADLRVTFPAFLRVFGFGGAAVRRRGRRDVRAAVVGGAVVERARVERVDGLAGEDDGAMISSSSVSEEDSKTMEEVSSSSRVGVGETTRGGEEE